MCVCVRMYICIYIYIYIYTLKCMCNFVVIYSICMYSSIPADRCRAWIRMSIDCNQIGMCSCIGVSRCMRSSRY